MESGQGGACLMFPLLHGVVSRPGRASARPLSDPGTGSPLL